MIKDRNEKGQFIKGLQPWNKGKHWNPGGNNVKTRFTKGHVPSTQKTIGSLRHQKDGYTYIKVGQKQWVAYHKYLWEKYHQQKLPQKMIVIFLDGDKQNFAINNLAAVTRSELMYINHLHLHFDDTELSRSGMLIARVKMKIKDKNG